MHRIERSTGARVRQVFVPEHTEAPLEAPAKVSGPALVAAKRTAAPAPEVEAERAEPKGTVPTGDLVRGYEFEKGKYVAFESEELESLAPKASTDMQVIEFVRFSEVDPVYLETSYYVSPDKGGEKPYHCSSKR